MSKLDLPDQPQSPTVMPPIPIVYSNEKLVWEYKEIMRNLAKEKALTEDELNKLGEEGWELAGILNDSMLAFFYFKRQK